MRVTKLNRQSDGSYRANVSEDGTTLTMQNKHGSWGTLPDGSGRWREALPDVAELLQSKLPYREKARR